LLKIRISVLALVLSEYLKMQPSSIWGCKKKFTGSS
jgi:hypothetical protein